MTTVPEMLGYGLIVTLVGFSMCFIILIGLAYMLDILKVISNKGSNGGKPDGGKPAAVEVSQTNEVELTEVVAEEKDNDELIAVISAALAAFMESGSNLVIKSIVRTGDNTPVWAKLGRQEQLYSRF